MCSTSESSERFLLKQVKDKENTFAVRKVKLQKRKLLKKSVMAMVDKTSTQQENLRFFRLQMFANFYQINSQRLSKFKKRNKIN